MEIKAGHLLLADIQIIMCLEMGKDGSVNILAFIKHLSSSSSLRILLEPGHRIVNAEGAPILYIYNNYLFDILKLLKFINM